MSKGGKWVTDNSLKGLADKFSYKYEAHAPTKVKFMPWLMCKHCGLVYLRNEFTNWAIKKGCLNHYHPGRKRFVG